MFALPDKLIQLYALVSSIIFLRYLLFAGLAFWLFYVLFRKRWHSLKIQSRFPKQADYWREIVYSLSTTAIFAAVGILLLREPVRSYTLIYDEIASFGWAYYFLSLMLIIFLHDAYFYWMHRLIHHPKLFKLVHLVHHRSTNPSPWAAYAFHPIEALFETGILLVVFVLPVHPSAIFFFVMFMMAFNVYGHLGYELFPPRFYQHPLGKWINTSVYHNLHHHWGRGNYGLYFTFWDRWMGTLHQRSEARYEQVTQRL